MFKLLTVITWRINCLAFVWMGVCSWFVCDKREHRDQTKAATSDLQRAAAWWGWPRIVTAAMAFWVDHGSSSPKAEKQRQISARDSSACDCGTAAAAVAMRVGACRRWLPGLVRQLQGSSSVGRQAGHKRQLDRRRLAKLRQQPMLSSWAACATQNSSSSRIEWEPFVGSSRTRRMMETLHASFRDFAFQNWLGLSHLWIQFGKKSRLIWK